jgi:hypothetical protein
MAGFNLGAPGVVLCGFAADVVRVGRGGFVGEDAFFEEFREVVAGNGGGEAEEDAVNGANEVSCISCAVD